MTTKPSSEGEYNAEMLAGLEWIWGEGFMSPGGREEVAEILRGVDLRDKTVLDIGCGIGGIDILLVKEYGAAQVIGIDVEAPLVDKARANIAKAGLENQISIKLVSPGPLAFDDESFDVVFSKDAMIHVPDKAAIYREISRVLAPKGVLAFSDWFGSDQAATPEFREWLDVVHLSFTLKPIQSATSLLAQLGFSDIESNDRNAWYLEYLESELDRVRGANFDDFAHQNSRELAEQRLHSSTLKKRVVEQGLLRPGHIRARKA